MKTLAVVLSLLLVVVPAGAQRMVERAVPSFYVPYAVSVSRAAAVEPESSSEDARLAEPVPSPSAPQLQRYPMRRPYGRFSPHYMGYPPPPGPPVSTGAALIIAGVVAGIIVAGVVKAHQ